MITNDTECAEQSQEVYTTLLSLTSCGPYEFTCTNGLCISIDERYQLVCLNKYAVLTNKCLLLDAMEKHTALMALMSQTAMWSIKDKVSAVK